MSLSVGIVGLPNVGKSTIFNALTSAGAQSENYPFCTIEPNVGIVPVPDERLGQITSIIKTQKVIPASVEFVDIAGLVKGASTGEGLGNQFLANIRETNAIMEVVRCFDDEEVVHVAGKVDPLGDIEVIEIELVLSDLQSLEKRAKKYQAAARGGDKEAIKMNALLDKATAHLEDGKALRSLTLSEDDALLLEELQCISAKPLLYCCNVDEAGIKDGNPHTKAVAEHAANVGANMVTICGALEAELSELPAEEQLEMLAEYDLKEPGLNRLAKEAYSLLGLQSYFTAGEKEVRAWTIPVGASAPQAAGVIHTDFERGFIKANIYELNDLIEHKTETEIKSAGKLRQEGKEYIVKDGDIIHFLFNV